MLYTIAPRSSIGRGSTNQLLAGNTSHRGSSPDHSVILSLQKELQEERNTVAALEKERDFYFGKLRDIEVFIQQDLEQSPEAGESQLLKEIQAVLYSTEVFMSWNATLRPFLVFPLNTYNRVSLSLRISRMDSKFLRMIMLQWRRSIPTRPFKRTTFCYVFMMQNTSEGHIPTKQE